MTSTCQHCAKPIRRNSKGIWGARKLSDPHPWYCDASPDAEKRHESAATMPNQHASPLVGWHPPADLGQWARSEAERRDVPLSVILTEALEAKREASGSCTHPKAARDPKNPGRCRCGAVNLPPLTREK